MRQQASALFVITKTDDVCDNLGATSLCGEGKTPGGKKRKDPIGQLFGNMNKTLGDLTYLGVKNEGQIIDTFIMYS